MTLTDVQKARDNRHSDIARTGNAVDSCREADGWHYPLTKEQEWDNYGYVVRDSRNSRVESGGPHSCRQLSIQDQIRFSLHVQDGLVDVVEDYLETNKKDQQALSGFED